MFDFELTESRGRKIGLCREAFGLPAPPKRLQWESAELPPVIYPEVRAITADWTTRNKTRYPKASLLGSDENATGLASCTYPYPIPFLRDHRMSAGFFGGPASEVYGRVVRADFVQNRGRGSRGSGYIRMIPKITHPEAVDGILTGRWLTVSVGTQVEAVFCSVCKRNLVEEGFCEHERGRTYLVGKEGKEREVECVWEMGPVRFVECSFVNAPSDVNARVLQPDLGDQAESTRILAPRQGVLYDLATGQPVRELRSPASDVPGTRPVYALGRSIECAACRLDEKTLSGKDRDRLPDSAFCGDPKRQEFPVPDAAHVRNGFARLGQYQGPTPKSKIHACLLRKAKQFGVDHDPSQCSYCRQGQRVAQRGRR